MRPQTVTIINPDTLQPQHTGQVISAIDYGTAQQPDWYIEFKCSTCGNKTHYLKQVQDGYADYIIRVTA